MEEVKGDTKKIAGYNQFVKLVRREKALRVWLASDADPLFSGKVMRELASHPDVKVDRTHNSAALAKLVGVEVETAVVTESV